MLDTPREWGYSLTNHSQALHPKRLVWMSPWYPLLKRVTRAHIAHDTGFVYLVGLIAAVW